MTADLARNLLEKGAPQRERRNQELEGGKTRLAPRVLRAQCLVTTIGLTRVTMIDRVLVLRREIASLRDERPSISGFLDVIAPGGQERFDGDDHAFA